MEEPIISVQVMQRIRSILWVLLLLIVIALVIELVRNHPVPASSGSQPAAVASSTESVTAIAATSTNQKKSVATSTSAKVSTAEKSSSRATNSTSTAGGTIATRIEDAYSTPPFSFDAVNVAARASVVNIMCLPRS